MDRASFLNGLKVVYKDGIAVLRLNLKELNETARELLYSVTDSKTVVFLSGGSTPRDLYKELSNEGKLDVGAASMVDERFGSKLHENSNERMILQTGLTPYLEKKKIPFYPILENKNIDETTSNFDETLRYLFNYFPKTVGILGIGEDGHTAGIPAGNPKLEIRNPNQFGITEDQSSLVSSYELEGYGQRVTMTFLALSKLDLIIILAFGKEKKKALRQMFKDGPIEEIPARFYLREGIAQKTILITDRVV